MEATARKTWTEDEYLALEAESDEKHELVNGEIIAMAGGSPAHNTIAMNVGSELRALIKSKGRPCRVLSSDQRVNVNDTGLYTYPDVTVLCGPARTPPKSPSSLTNPLMLVEVLSDDTEAYDRGAKFAHYQRLPSLESYLLVSQKTSEELLQREGKEKLATDILREAARPFGGLDDEESVDQPRNGSIKSNKSRNRVRPGDLPVQRVLFSSFIVQ